MSRCWSTLIKNSSDINGKSEDIKVTEHVKFEDSSDSNVTRHIHIQFKQVYAVFLWDD